MDNEKEQLKRQMNAMLQASAFLRDEARRLARNDKNVMAAIELIFDEIIGVADYWHNYSAAIGNNGKRYEMEECFEEFQDHLRTVYKGIVGEDYQPEITRLLNWKNKQEEGA